MDESQSTRPAPRLIRVPPPEGELAPTRVLYGCAFAVVVVALCLGALIGDASGISVTVVFVSFAAFLFWLPHWLNPRYRRKRAEFVAALGDAEHDAWAAAIVAKWRRPSKTLKPDEVRDTLRELQGPNPERSCIVCLGMVDVPAVEDVFFEPEIITPTRALGNRMWFILIAVAIVAVWVLQLAGVIPGKVINVGSFGYLLAMGASAGGVWIWRSAIRPTYIRMAPGMVQILEFHHGRKRPTIRSYPVDADTLAIFRGSTTERKSYQLTLTLMRNEQKDKLEFWSMRNRKAVVERTWQTLLSTAPTPPLSDEDLLG